MPAPTELIQQIPTTSLLAQPDDFMETGGATVGSTKTPRGQFPTWVQNVAALQALPIAGVTQPVLVFVLGQTTIADGNQNPFIYSSTSTATADGVNVIAPGTGSGRWLICRVVTAASLGLGAGNSPQFAGLTLNGPAILTTATWLPETGGATSGAIGLNFTDKTLHFCGINGNATFSTSNIGNGDEMMLIVQNLTNSPVTVAWPAWIAAGPALPLSIPALASIRIDLLSLGTTDSSVYARYTASALPPGGAAGGDLAGTFPNPTVGALSGVAGIREKPIGYASGGNIQVRFDLGAYDSIALTIAASFSPAGSTGLAAGARQILDLTNTTGAALALTWPASWKLASGALPVSIAPGQWIRVVLYSTSALEAGIVASYFGAGILSVTAGTNVSVTGTAQNPIINATSAGYLNEYNVSVYGASPAASAATNTAAVNAAILAMNAAGGGRLIFPGAGTYQVNGAITAITVPCEIVGFGLLVTIVSQLGAFDLFTLATASPCYVHNLWLVTTSTKTCLVIGQIGTANSATLVNFCQFTGGLIGVACVFTINQMTISNSTFGCTNSITIGAYAPAGAVVIGGRSSCILNCNNIGGGATNAVWIMDGDGVDLIGNQIVSATTAVRFTLPNLFQRSDLWLTGNHIEVSGDGLLLDGTTNGVTNANQFANITIAGNEFATGGIGVHCTSNTTVSWLARLVIVGNVFANSPGGCVIVFGCIGGTVGMNTMQTNGAVSQLVIDASCSFVAGADTNTYIGGAPRGYTDSQSYVFANLTSAATSKGARAFITDCTTNTFGAAAAGGGTNKMPVWCDGVGWKVG